MPWWAGIGAISHSMVVLCIQVNTKWGYRDGVKRKGDKIGMDCTRRAVG